MLFFFARFFILVFFPVLCVFLRIFGCSIVRLGVLKYQQINRTIHQLAHSLWRLRTPWSLVKRFNVILLNLYAFFSLRFEFCIFCFVRHDGWLWLLTGMCFARETEKRIDNCQPRFGSCRWILHLQTQPHRRTSGRDGTGFPIKRIFSTSQPLQITKRNIYGMTAAKRVEGEMTAAENAQCDVRSQNCTAAKMSRAKL